MGMEMERVRVVIVVMYNTVNKAFDTITIWMEDSEIESHNLLVYASSFQLCCHT